jgi:hypothetical protein
MLAGARCSTGNLMSQDKPNSQPPLSPEPNAGKSDTTALKKTQTFGQTRNRVQTVLKTQSITALRDNSSFRRVLVRLEAENTAGTLPPDATGETPSLLEKLQLGWSGVLAKNPLPVAGIIFTVKYSFDWHPCRNCYNCGLDNFNPSAWEAS